MPALPRFDQSRAMALPRILLVDDHALVRAGIRSLLESDARVVVVGEAASAGEALAQLDALRPDLVLLDIGLREESGLDVAREARVRWPGLKVLILSMHASQEYVTEAVAAGASGYVLKDSAADELNEAIAALVRGETYFSPAI